MQPHPFQEDDDIKRYAWKVISATISIFCAVLLFQGFNGLVEDYCIDGGMKLFGIEEESPLAKFWECFVDIAQLLFWLTSMQLVLAITSGAIAEMSPYLWQPEDTKRIYLYTYSGFWGCPHLGPRPPHVCVGVSPLHPPTFSVSASTTRVS